MLDLVFVEGGDLGALNLQGCKSYLCKHGLRVSGTKMVCIQRIKEHWRLVTLDCINYYSLHKPL